MAKSTKTNTLEQSLYAIEQAIQAQIDPHQKKIQSLKKAVDRVLSDAQKAFEHNEKTYEKTLNTLKKNYTKKERLTSKSHDDSIETQKARLNNTTKEHDKRLKTLSSTYDDHIKSMDDNLKRLEKEKAKLLKDIEARHADKTKLYDDKIRLHEESLNESKAKIEKKIEALLSEVQDAYTTIKAAYNHIEKDVETIFSKAKETFQQNNDATLDELKKNQNALEYKLNQLRKTFNDTSKALFSQLTTLSNKLEAPFKAIQTQLKSINEEIIDYKAFFIKSLEDDCNIEHKRLEKALSELDAESTDKAQSAIIERRIDLNQQRKKALTEHFDALEVIVKNLTSAIQDVEDNTLDALKKSLLEHEQHLQTQLDQLKNKITIFQQANPKRHETLKSFFEQSSAITNLNQYKDYFQAVFKAFYQFELNRLETLYNTTKNLKPLYKENDEIRVFLDTKEARKEIETHKVKIETEQQDAALQQDMKRRQITHEKTIETIEYEHAKKELIHQHQIEKALETKRLKDREQEKIAALNYIENDRKIDEAKAIYTLRKDHVSTDLEQLKKRHEIETELHKCDHEIRLLTIQKEHDLKVTEEKHRLKSERARIQLMIDEQQSTLARIEGQIHKKESKIQQDKTRQKDKAKQEFEHEKHRLEQRLKHVEKTHQDNLAFIQQAYERETQEAQENIKDVETMINGRFEPIEKHHQKLKEALDYQTNHIKHAPDDLKSLLVPLKEQHQESFKQHVALIIEGLEEAYDFIHRIDVKALENTHKGRKKHQANQKLKQQLKKNLELLKQRKMRYLNQLEQDFKAPLMHFNKQETIPVSTLRHHIEVLINTLSQHLDKWLNETKQTLDNCFSPLYEADKKRLEKAKQSLEQATEEEKARYETEKQPITLSLQGVQDKLDEALAKIDESFEAQTKEALEGNYNTQKQLRDDIAQYQQKLKTLEETFQAHVSDANAEKEAALNEEKASFKHKQENASKRFEERKKTIESRASDAAKIYEHAIANNKQKAEDISVSLEDFIETTQEDFNYVKQNETEQIERLKQEKQMAIQKEESKLKEDLKAYENQILSSKAKLENQIETALRAINDKIRIKSARKAHLDETIQKKEYNLYEAYKKAHKNLQSKLKNIIENQSLETKLNTKKLDDLKALNNEQVEAFIQATIEDINQ